MVDLRGKRAYLDASTIIYAFEGVSQFSNLKSGLLDLLSQGLLVAVTSELTLLEVVTGTRKAQDSQLEAKYRSFLSPSPVMFPEPISNAVLEKAIDLRSQFGLKTPDAIHIATGMLLNCDVFVTRDQAWNRAGVTVAEPQLVS